MEILEASLISGKVITWQIALGVIQLVGRGVGEKTGLIIAYVLVVIWTITKTYNELMILQLIIQSIVAFLLYKTIKKMR